MVRRFALVAFVLVATPAMAQNQFPDPNLHEPADMTFSGYPTARHSLPAIVWDNASAIATYGTAGTVNSDLLAAWPASDVRYMSVNVADYVTGTMTCRFRSGSFVDLNVSGNGPTTPVAITAGVSGGGLVCRGSSGATFRVQQSSTAPAISITP
ncbi:MAG TPA: hypothetical protein VGO55_13120 [Allosphingosinicella sp.]|nr:hypothetical protein [Allosphingosinicella sp.]